MRKESTKGGGAKPRLLSGGISAFRLVRLVRSVHSCAMLAKIVFFLKTKVLCPAAASGGFVQLKNWLELKLVKKVKILKALGMGLPIVESLSGLQESVFSLFRAPQRNSRQKIKKKLNFIKLTPIPPISPRWANGCLGSPGLLLSDTACHGGHS